MSSRNMKNGSIDRNESEDDMSNLEGGDLGLGFGLKPGGLPRSPAPERRLSNHVSSPASVTNSEPDLHRDVDRFIIDSDKSGSKLERSCSLHCNERDKRGLRYGNNVNVTTKRSTFSSRRAKTESDTESTIDTRSRGTESDDEDSVLTENGEDEFPQFAEVALGTSIRQQKQLFEHDIHEMYKSYTKGSIHSPMTACWGCDDEMDIDEKLKKTELEVEILRNELERCQKQLEAKYKAIQVLHKKSQVAQCEHDVSEHKIREMTHIMEQQTSQDKSDNRLLEIIPEADVESSEIQSGCMLSGRNAPHIEEINKLQFELEYRQGTLMESQQTWAQRFDSVCQENVSLVQLLEDRTEELRRMYAEKMGLARERDELLALLDVKERLKYEQNRQSTPSDDAYGRFSSNELAVLGACNCRGSNPDPCGCAYAAANLRKENIKLREEIELHKKRREEAYSTVDAYRMAFEEQLFKNKAMTMKMADLSLPSPNKKKKALGALKWLVKQLNDDEPPPRQRQNAKNHDDEDAKEMLTNSNDTSPSDNERIYSDISGCQSEKEIIQVLLEKLSDKSEVLAQQKIAARMLASRTKELEQKLLLQEDGKPIE
ncbi:coiled-coil domain-containing protein 125-like isoform X2 [Lineus longissimus]|uniref:coiled-coil domain-containing protein 125-like isoform X2 n=1 Tax=Lineus longissimus TaxID=88925 RepID=UPI00315DFD61